LSSKPSPFSTAVLREVINLSNLGLIAIEPPLYSNTFLVCVKDERRHREMLRLTIGTLKTSSMRGTYWSTDGNIRKLLVYRPSIQDMKLILEPMCYLFIGDAAYLGKKATERDEYFYTLRKQLVEYFLEKYSSSPSNNNSSV
jgi:hypothetical protein